jgi:BirA family biotin operon repressor/biotin-[acetyl-CoA-carboxylase] ligase
MNTERTDPERAPLSAAALSGSLIAPGSFWREIAVTGLTGSTNADLLAQAAGRAPEGSVLVAEAQTAGRGRMGRTWLSPPGAALMFSVLLRPDAVRPARRGWIPLLAGVAIASAIRSLTGLDARLKWPNDVLVGDAKLAGILAEQSADAIVVGVGINVSTRQAELPVETATSLAIEGASCTDRQLLLCGVLGEIERLYLAWSGTASPGDPDASGLRDAYRRRCATLGRQVRVEFPGGDMVRGTALDVDADGRLLLRTADGALAVSAGDVVHLR